MTSLASGIDRPHDPNGKLVFVRGSAAKIWDVEGKDYFDFTCGYSACNFGHGHPKLVAAAEEQLNQLAFVTGGSSPWRDKLAEKLCAIAPFESKAKAWISTTGARAVEIAWKIAFNYRPGRLVHLDRSFHGRSLATATITDTDALPIVSGDVQSIPYPDCHRCPLSLKPLDCQVRCAEEYFIQLEASASEISAILVEPIPGARGYLSAPHQLFQRLSCIARSHGITLISDEIQTGLGRIGSMFGCTTQGWTPDIVVLGKSLGGGILPLSAVIGKQPIMDSLPPGIESETFAATPLSCRIGYEALDLLADGSLIENGTTNGNVLRKTVESILSSSRNSVIATAIVEGQGAYAAIEFAPSEIELGAQVAWDLTLKAQLAGVLVHRTGPYRNRIVMLPPLTLAKKELAEACDRLRSAWIS